MPVRDYTGILPEQFTGKEIVAEASVELKDVNQAISFFAIVKERLLNVNEWHHYAGILSAEFQLFDTSGHEVKRPAQKGDYIRIDIPGPGSKKGGGYDWARIEEIKEITKDDVQSIGVRVRPSANPFGNKDDVAHFYDDASTGNFIATREKTKISTTIIDRNTKPNDDTESLTDKIRNTTVGIGAIAAFSKIQWQKLAEGLIAGDKK